MIIEDTLDPNDTVTLDHKGGVATAAITVREGRSVATAIIDVDGAKKLRKRLGKLIRQSEKRNSWKDAEVIAVSGVTHIKLAGSEDEWVSSHGSLYTTEGIEMYMFLIGATPQIVL